MTAPRDTLLLVKEIRVERGRSHFDLTTATTHHPMETRIALFQKKEIRKTLHADEWWFVIVDVVAALTDSTNPAEYIKKMRRRDEPLSEALKGGDNLSPPLR